MKVYSVFLLGAMLASLPTCNGQCTLCADGTSPPNDDALLSIPGLGELPCSTVDLAIGNASPNDCTRAQAGGYLICGCPTVLNPNLDLPCAFCPDGELPTNLDQEVTLPDGSNETCQDLVAIASTLDNSTDSVFKCDAIATAVSADCGCGSASTNSSESAAPSTSPATNSSASQPTAAPSLEPSAGETTMPVSPAPTAGETVMPLSAPTFAPTALPSPATLTTTPTTELTTSNGHRIVGAHVVLGSALTGVFAALL